MTDGFMDNVQHFLLGNDFIQRVMVFTMDVIMIITNIILLPINLLIVQFIPEFDDALSSIAQLFDHAGTYVGWSLSMIGIPPVLLTLVIAYYIFTITTSLGTWGFKLALKWVDTFR